MELYRKTLIEANVQKADLVVAVTSQDDTNMVISSLANDLGAKRTLGTGRRPGIFYDPRGDRTQCPRFLRDYLCLSTGEFRTLTLGPTQPKAPMSKAFPPMPSPSPPSMLVRVVAIWKNPAGDIDLGKGAQIIGIFRDFELRRPVEISHLYDGDKILVATKLKKLPMIMRRISQKYSGKKAVIIGGGDVGFQLAEVTARCRKSTDDY